MDILEAMAQRRSVRTFDGKGLTPEQKESLEQAIAESSSPFGGQLTIRLKAFDLKGGYKPGTYGFISGADHFFLLGIGSDEASALTAGFRFQQVVLKAWQLGLGTCWIGGTFKGSDFDRGESWPVGETLKIVCPVGTAAKQTIKEKIMRMAVGSKHRKPFGQLFFNGDFNTSLQQDSRYGESLEMLRLAPSSTNSQPWRALVDGDTVHFYCRDKGAFAVMDSGIGLCQFWEAERYRGHSGTFAKKDDAPTPPAGLRYLVSYS